MNAFVRRIFKTDAAGTLSDIKIGSISSDVERKTASSVPIEISPPEYRLAAAAENPHCGTTPTAAPAAGLKRPNFCSRFTDAFDALRSSTSITM